MFKEIKYYLTKKFFPLKSIDELNYRKPEIRREDREKFKILFVDDNELAIIDTLVESCGYDIKYKNVLEDLYDASIYDVILCDLNGVYNHHVLEGAELIKQLREMYVNKQLILYTAGTLSSDQVEVISKYADKRIKKGQNRETWEAVLDESISTIIDPTESWKRIKKDLERRKVKTIDIARFEDTFVRCYEDGKTKRIDDLVKMHSIFNTFEEYERIIKPIVVRLLQLKK